MPPFMEARRQRDVFLIALAAALAAVTGALYIYINLYFTDGFLTLPLDDAYIFLHYARNFAAGHPLVYNLGDPPTTGVTSYLYLLILTPLALIFRTPNALVWASFILNVVFYGAGVWLFARVARHLFEGRYVIPSTLIYATTGPITFHALGGMDGGLVILALLFALYSYILYKEYGRLAVFVVALAALTLARPEGIIAAAILAALALIGAGPKVREGGPARRRSKWFVLLGLAPVPAYLALNYLAGGYVTPASFLSKSILAHKTQPWAVRLAAIIAYTIYVVKSVLGGLNGYYVKGFYNANTVHAAANYFAPLTLAFFLVGWGRAARKSWSSRKPSAAFAAGLVFLACAAGACVAVPIPRHFARYIAPYFPLFVIGVLGGIDGLASLIRYGRPTISHAAMFWTGAAYFLVFGLISSAYFWVAHGMSARDIRFQHVAVARYIRDNTPESVNIFTHDVGALAYYGGRRVVDIEGLITREAWRFGSEGWAGAAEFVRREGKRGDYFVGYFDVYPFDEAGVVTSPEYIGLLVTNTMAGASEMAVAEFAPEVFEASPPPAVRALRGFEPADEVNVADVISESAHGYLFRPRGASTLFGFAGVLPLATAGGVNVFEAGRLVSGVEEFTVAVPGGRDAIAAVRCEPPFRANVHVNGVPAGTWEVPPVGADAYVDAFFRIPAKLVGDGRMRISLKTAGDDLSYNRPARYYFYSRAE
jgi:hypothetical protein